MKALETLATWWKRPGAVERAADALAHTVTAQHARARERALELMEHHVRQIGAAGNWNGLAHLHGVASGYLTAVFEAGLVNRDEALGHNNRLCVAVNSRSQALMLDLVPVGEWKH